MFLENASFQVHVLCPFTQMRCYLVMIFSLFTLFRGLIVRVTFRHLENGVSECFFCGRSFIGKIGIAGLCRIQTDDRV